MRTLSTSLSVPSSSIQYSLFPLSNTNQDVKWKYGESNKDKTLKPRKNLWFNRRGKDGQEDNNIKNYRPIYCLSVVMVMVKREGTTRGVLKRELAAQRALYNDPQG